VRHQWPKRHRRYEEPAGLIRAVWVVQPAALDDVLLRAERAALVRGALARLPGRCPELVAALLRTPGAGYADLAEELALPRGSIGPLRSRCLACLRRVLTPESLRA
jgi:DNA-directed RNA polymerase specialized sigma24 family protein